MKLKVLVLEDNPAHSMVLETILSRQGYEVICTSNALDAIKSFRTHHPHLLLLDIMVKGDLTGIDAAGIMLKEREMPFIYVTDYPEKYLEEKGGPKPWAFTSKPIKELDVLINIDLVWTHFPLPTDADMGITAPVFPNLFFALDTVWLKRKGGEPYQKILIKNILYLEAEGSYLRLHYVDGKSQLIIFNLKDFLPQYPNNLIQANKSEAVNLAYVDAFSRKEGVTLKCSKVEGTPLQALGQKIRLTDLYYDAFVEALKRYRYG